MSATNTLPDDVLRNLIIAAIDALAPDEAADLPDIISYVDDILPPEFPFKMLHLNVETGTWKDSYLTVGTTTCENSREHAYAAFVLPNVSGLFAFVSDEDFLTSDLGSWVALATQHFLITAKAAVTENARQASERKAATKKKAAKKRQRKQSRQRGC